MERTRNINAQRREGKKKRIKDGETKVYNYNKGE